jgi:hypothetical protein
MALFPQIRWYNGVKAQAILYTQRPVARSDCENIGARTSRAVSLHVLVCIERAAAAGVAWPRLATDDPNLYGIREGSVVIAANYCIGCIGDAFSLVFSVRWLRR